MYISLSLALLAPALAFGASLTLRDTPYSCNNSPDLCSRSYSNITQLGAHDSPFLRNGTTSSNTFSFTDSGNQNVNSTSQLTAGVRLLSAQIHQNNGAWHLCHTSCSLLDAGTLSAWLSEIKTWMDDNPHEVITLLLVNSDNASAQDLDAQFKAANISSYGYIPPSPSTAATTWPTLQDMITNNTRLVTFVASLPTNTIAPYLLDEFTFVFENSYNVTSLSDFTCTADRPAAVRGQTTQAVQTGRLPLVNHLLYTNQGMGIQTPDTGNITTTNGQTGTGSLGEAATTCTAAYGRQPAFLLVNFFDQGQALQVVDALNGITATGRGDVSSIAAHNIASQTANNMAVQTANAGMRAGMSVLACGVVVTITLLVMGT